MLKLEKITPDNLMPILQLTTNADGITTVFEKFVASNALSIAQSKYFPSYETFGIFADGTAVGFAMFGIDEDDGSLWIPRFMIDCRFQGKGYGKAGFEAVLKILTEKYPSTEIFLSFEPENEIAKKLYEHFGFSFTGKSDEDGELIYKLTSDV